MEAMSASTTPGRQARLLHSLEDLLSESPESVARRERRYAGLTDGTFEQPVVLMGAGRAGARIGELLLGAGARVLAFADNAPGLHGTSRLGLPVMSPDDAARSYGTEALFVVTIWNSEHSYVETEARLRSLGCESIAPWVPVAWAFGDALLPQYAAGLPSTVLALRGDVLSQADVWADPRSAEVYRQQVAWRMSGDFADLGDVDPVQYFAADVIRPTRDEVFVDCGAYIGDTLIEFTEWAPGFRAVHAFEPDPDGYAALLETIDGFTPEARSRIHTYRSATGAGRGNRLFMGDGAGGRLVDASGDAGDLQEVQSVSLDEVLANEPVTFIKMDIEGAEREALSGGAKLIRDQGPVLALSAYHLQDDLWELPKLVRSLLPDHLLYLRPHRYDSFDCVLYAVPPDRKV